MKKALLLLVLSISVASIFFSCQKEYNERNGTNTPETNRRGTHGPGNNNPPVANAGADQVITLPTNTVNLNGSATDPDNNITSYQWTKISGPSSFTIANPNSVQTQVTNLVEGVYQFELKVTDKFGLYDNDVVQVTVLNSSEPSPPPCTTCKIVFVSARDGNNEIYTSNTDGSNITRLTNAPGNDDQPVWSPDGTRIAFTSDRDGYPGLYIMNADGSNVVRRTFSVDPNGGILGLTWSPDGTKIAYSDYASYNDYYGLYEGADIYTVSATSGSPLLLFQGADVGWPDWSPDGTKIALVAQFPTPFEGFTDYHIYTINSDGTGFTALTSGYDLFTCPSWSPNGAKLAVTFSSDYGSNAQVAVMNSDGSGFTLLMSGAAWAGTGTSWSSDGAAIVYSSLSGSMNNVSWVAANGSAGGTIVTNGWNADWQH